MDIGSIFKYEVPLVAIHMKYRSIIPPLDLITTTEINVIVEFVPVKQAEQFLLRLQK